MRSKENINRHLRRSPWASLLRSFCLRRSKKRSSFARQAFGADCPPRPPPAPRVLPRPPVPSSEAVRRPARVACQPERKRPASVVISKAEPGGKVGDAELHYTNLAGPWSATRHGILLLLLTACLASSGPGRGALLGRGPVGHRARPVCCCLLRLRVRHAGRRGDDSEEARGMRHKAHADALIRHKEQALTFCWLVSGRK